MGVPYRFGPLAFQPLIAKTSLGVWLGTVFSASSLNQLFKKAGLHPLAYSHYFLRFFIGMVACRDTAARQECNT